METPPVDELAAAYLGYKPPAPVSGAREGGDEEPEVWTSPVDWSE